MLLCVWRRKIHKTFLIIIKINKRLPAVVASRTYHVLVIVRKAYVGDMRRVPEVPLVFGLLGKSSSWGTGAGAAQLRQKLGKSTRASCLDNKIATYKFLGAWEIKQFHQAKVVSCDYI